MRSKILIVGPAASGKDYLKKKFEEKLFAGGVFSTTRPIRENETNGVDYFFVDGVENMPNDFVVGNSYNNWDYRLPVCQWDKGEVFIFTPEYLNQLSEEKRKQCVVIYVCPNWFVRLFRLLKRGDVDKVFRRMRADRKQFKNFANYDIKITNSKF